MVHFAGKHVYFTAVVGAGEVKKDGTSKFVPFKRFCTLISGNDSPTYKPSVTSLTATWTWSVDGRVVRKHSQLIANSPADVPSDKFDVTGLTWGDVEEGGYLHNKQITVAVTLTKPGYESVTLRFFRFVPSD